MPSEMQLVCEGLCNPGLPMVDALIVQSNVDGRRMPVRSDLYAGIRHTPHVEIAPAFWSCVLCRTPRRFGK